VVKESLRRADRARFEASVRAKVESLGSVVTAIEYVGDADEPVRFALERHASGPGRSHVVLTAGGRSTDPSDPFFTAIEALRGRVVRHGVPAHPGSMLWLARIGRTAILGLPTCGAYSKATAADLLLPRLLTGEPPTRRTVSHLGHGGVLTREMRFRFPPYARELEAPDG
jgi:molybdopterin biosynthesis enzyme